MKILLSLFLLLAFCNAFCQEHSSSAQPVAVIGAGQVPDIATVGSSVHLAWGKGDSILYAISLDNGLSFSAPEVVDVVPKLFSFAMRGPQVAATKTGACIVACTQRGNLVGYQKKNGGRWVKTTRVNDRDTTAKEGFLDLQSDGGENLFAAWLDIRKGGHNNIVGTRSTDGGKTWSANKLLYQSPDGHVCECCKPTVAVQGNVVSVMFRNWLKGSRDLYLVRSADGGMTFGPGEKLGRSTWKLEGCPMDGGGLVLTTRGEPKTVWRRRDTVFAATPNRSEMALGVGRGCTMTTAAGNDVYAWVEKGDIVLLPAGGSKQKVGKGSLPVLKALGNKTVILVWENDKSIQKAVLGL